MAREVESHHFGTTQYSYGIFQAFNLLNMAMVHWIMIHCCMVEPRLPANKHAQWKKWQKKSAGLHFNIYEFMWLWTGISCVHCEIWVSECASDWIGIFIVHCHIWMPTSCSIALFSTCMILHSFIQV